MKNEEYNIRKRKDEYAKKDKGDKREDGDLYKGEYRNKKDENYFVLEPKDLENILNYLAPKPWIEVNGLIQKLSNLQKGKRLNIPNSINNK